MYNIIKLHSADSTNSYLKRKYKGLKNLTVVVSKIQTDGKGRMGRTWKSQPGNLFFSMLFKLPRNSEGISVIPLKAALAVYDILESSGIKAEIKWPNDVLVNKKKICGILVENIIEDENIVVVGIGLNVNNSSFDTDIETKAVSMIELTGKERDIYELAGDLATALEARLNSPLKEYKEKCLTIGSKICAVYSHREVWGRGVDINEDGSLLMETEEKELISVYGGEVSIRSERGYV